MDAYEADYVTRDGRLVIDDSEVRRRFVKAIDGYTAIYRKGCTPPNSVTWTNADNNKAFLAQTIVMTVNQTLLIPNTLKATRPEDYYDNAATIDWPDGAYGQPLAIETFVNRAAVFKDGRNVDNAKEFVRFLVGEGWLAHYLDFAGDRMLPTMPKLLQAPFWLDPGDPHRMRSAMQLLTPPRYVDYYTPSRSAVPQGLVRRQFGKTRSTASSPRGSVPSRRSTRRSRRSSRSWANKRTCHVVGGAFRPNSSPFNLDSTRPGKVRHSTTAAVHHAVQSVCNIVRQEGRRAARRSRQRPAARLGAHSHACKRLTAPSRSAADPGLAKPPRAYGAPTRQPARRSTTSRSSQHPRGPALLGLPDPEASYPIRATRRIPPMRAASSAGDRLRCRCNPPAAVPWAPIGPRRGQRRPQRIPPAGELRRQCRHRSPARGARRRRRSRPDTALPRRPCCRRATCRVCAAGRRGARSAACRTRLARRIAPPGQPPGCRLRARSGGRSRTIRSRTSR